MTRVEGEFQSMLKVGSGACMRWVLKHVKGLIEGGFWSMLNVGFDPCIRWVLKHVGGGF